MSDFWGLDAKWNNDACGGVQADDSVAAVVMILLHWPFGAFWPLPFPLPFLYT